MKTLCIAGKNNIAVDVLKEAYKCYNGKMNFVCVPNRNDDGIDKWQRSLRKYCKEIEIPVVELEELYTIEELVFLSLEFDRIIKPQDFLPCARLYNIHFSLLPAYKGMYTSALPILMGEKTVGVTLHNIDAGIDTGDIIAQEAFPLDGKNCQELYLSYIQHGTELVLQYLDMLISGKLTAYPQSAENSTYYSKRCIDYSHLSVDLNQTAELIERQIRAFHFRAYQMPEVYSHKIISAKITKIKSTCKPGTIIMESASAMMLSTVDYNIILFFDRLAELIAACKNGNLKIVREICSVKEHVNERNQEGVTPLLVALSSGHMAVACELLMNGADIPVEDTKEAALLNSILSKNTEHWKGL